MLPLALFRRLPLKGFYRSADRVNLRGQKILSVGNPVQRGHRFQRKADSNPVIADSR
jgi:hypothetical protein